MKLHGPALKTHHGRTVKSAGKKVDPELQTTEHLSWAAFVIKRAGYRCEAIKDGKRCERRRPDRLFADHKIERRDGGDPLDPANGQCLCGSCHSKKTMAMRAARMSEA